MVVIFSTQALPQCATSRYALSARQIAAIVHALPTMTVPGSAPHVAGIAWWRSAVVPVIDFRGSGHRDTGSRSRYIIAHHGGPLREALVAIPVDSEIGLHRVTSAHLQVRGVPRPTFATGMFEIDGHPVALLDIDAVLAPNPNDGKRLSA
jgi:chemotaxis signal transduction protein